MRFTEEGVEKMTEKEMFTFEVNNRKFIFLYDELTGKPIKIGDGTFGAVFKLKGDDLKPYAVKILYNNSGTSIQVDKSGRILGSDKSGTILGSEQDVFFQAAKERFENEKKAMLSIRHALRDEIETVISGIVEHIGSTDKFPYRGLEKKTEKQTEKQIILLSPHALVLDYYHGTLKDLLENKNEHASGLSGYELLREMDFRERIRMMLPFLRGVASGLNTMHKAGYVHLDIKPANIFWQNVDKEIKAAIGDLGYIRKFHISSDTDTDQESDTDQELDTVRSESQAALGTLHYRSPEQRDFQDTCEVEILKQFERDIPVKKGKDETVIILPLRTTDPKFSDTIIEKGDNLQFLNNINRDFEILNIETIKDITTIEVTIPSNDLNYEPDKGTQVKIYKNQGVRTDIYGFGAIAYDLITCGKSPEHFYSYLAMYDLKDSKNAKNESVETIIENYVGNIETRSNRNSIYSSVFEHFHDKEKLQSAPSEFVRLILKCMFYHLQGTYYREQKDKAFDTILEDLVKLNDEYRGVTEVYRNVLTSGKRPKHVDHGDSRLCDLRRYVDEIQSIGIGNMNESTLLTRVYRAALRFDRLINLVQDSTTGLGQQDYEKYDYSEETEKNYTKFFFSELTPELVSVVNGDKLEFKSKVYNTMTQYISDLLENKVSGKLIYYPLEPFSPHDILGDMKRKIELCTTESPNKNEYRYKFVEASMLGDSIQPGDWIVVHQKEVRRIKSINKDTVELYSPIKLNETILKINANTETQALSSDSNESTPETNFDTDPLTTAACTSETNPQSNSSSDPDKLSFEPDDTIQETNPDADPQEVSFGTNDALLETDLDNDPAMSSGTNGTIPDPRSSSDTLKVSCFDEKNAEYYYYRNLDPMEYYISMLGTYIYQLFFVGLGKNSISTPNSVRSVKAQLESSPSMQKDLWGVLKKSLNTKAYSKNRDMTERVSAIFQRLASLYLILSLTDQKAFLSKQRTKEVASEIDSLWGIWIDIRDDIEKCFELIHGQMQNPNEQTFAQIRSRLDSQEIDEKKLQVDLTTHFQNMLKMM